jgi:hypothetical protein
MAQEGPEHKTMVEAFARRLRQLYPESATNYSEGKVVRPVGLKPDIYFKHPDGRQWAFEMVYGNSSAAKLTKNHLRYAEAGISDHWILWDELRPRSGPPASPDQGVIASTLDVRQAYQLTKPQQAIIDAQTGDVRYLYAFTVDAGLASIALTRLLSIGLLIYRLEAPFDAEQCMGYRDFNPILNLQFQADGRPIAPDDDQDIVGLQAGLDRLGLATSPVFVPSVLMEQLEHFLQSPTETTDVLIPLLIKQFFSQLPPDQLQDLAGLQSPELQAQIKALKPPAISMEELAHASNDPAIMQRLGDDILRMQSDLDSLNLPTALRAFLDQFMQAQQFTQAAEFMRWQEDSPALQQVRSNDEQPPQ